MCLPGCHTRIHHFKQPPDPWPQRAYRPGVRGVLLDYRVLGGDWGGLEVTRVACRTAIWWVGCAETQRPGG